MQKTQERIEKPDPLSKLGRETEKSFKNAWAIQVWLYSHNPNTQEAEAS